jgi:hypothetical protein
MPKDNRTLQNVPTEDIARILRANELNILYKEEQKPTKVCPVCESSFTEHRRWQKFCTPKCRNVWAGYVRQIPNVKHGPHITSSEARGLTVEDLIKVELARRTHR